MSVSGGMDGISVNYDVVKDACKECDLESLDVFKTVKHIASKMKG